MSPPIRLGFLSSKNYLDKNAFSGIVYYMHKALQKQVNLQIINLGKPWQPNCNHGMLSKLSNKLRKSRELELNLRGSKYFANRHRFASLVEEQLKQTPCDLIFAPVASLEVACLQSKTPLIYLSDATPNILWQFYQYDLNQQEIDCLSQIESDVITRANSLIYSSNWAANSAIFDYGASPDKVHIIPFGANLDSIPSKIDLAQARQDTKCNLLFLGKSWTRKGGDIAYQALISLLSLGIEAELTIVGCTPPDYVKHSNLKVIPYLDKNNPQQGKQLEKIFLQSHFLLFPTRADCSPIVICEANAFGLPVITSDVGGISSIIHDGINGYMFPLSASGEDYAKCIAEIFSDSVRYKQLSESAREEYDHRLNWNSWANSFYRVVEKALESKSQLTLH